MAEDRVLDAGRGDQLVAATGVPDAIFCHAAGFYASAASREGIRALVSASIAAGDGLAGR